jgi:hypothetical protein
MSKKNVFNDLKNKFPSASIELFGPIIWFQYSNELDVLNFEIMDCTTIDVSSEKTGISYKKQLIKIISNLDPTIAKHKIPSSAIEILISDLFDSAGFNETTTKSELEDDKVNCTLNTYYDELKKLIVNPNREILIVSFGEKFKSPSSMEQHKISTELPFKCDKTFDARHINSSKPKGGGLRDLRGTDNIIQKCIESGSGFEFVMNCIVKSIEKNNYKTIGIFCTAGHHRSVACVELLKKNLYPNAKIKHLHINR